MRTTRILLLLWLATPAIAVANRVFVASTGTDTGACPITAPCRSFAYAVTQVTPGGEIIALDTAGYGTLAVAQPVSVFAAPGATAFVAVSSGTGLAGATGINDKVTLRNLALSGTGGTIGIDFSSGLSLAIEDCIVSGFTSAGVQIARTLSSTPMVEINNSTIRNNGTGVSIGNVGMGLVAALNVANSTVCENVIGLLVSDNTRGAATDSVFTGNSQIGVESSTTANGSGPDFTLERCTIAQNQTGISAGSMNVVGGPTHGIIRIAHDQIFGNTTGVFNWADGSILSLVSNNFATNTIEGNVIDGTPSGAYAAK